MLVVLESFLGFSEPNLCTQFLYRFRPKLPLERVRGRSRRSAMSMKIKHLWSPFRVFIFGIQTVNRKACL